MYEIHTTPQVTEWLEELSGRDFDRIGAALDALAESGPTLGRPVVDRITGSRHHNMKELRSVGGHLRALFAFDPNRQAIVLVGGDKTDDWRGWYERNVPLADDLYDEWLEGLWR